MTLSVGPLTVDFSRMRGDAHDTRPARSARRRAATCPNRLAAMVRGRGRQRHRASSGTAHGTAHTCVASRCSSTASTSCPRSSPRRRRVSDFVEAVAQRPRVVAPPVSASPTPSSSGSAVPIWAHAWSPPPPARTTPATYGSTSSPTSTRPSSTRFSRPSRPATTLVVVISKTFTTVETLANARAARSWLLSAMSEADLVAPPLRRDHCRRPGHRLRRLPRRRVRLLGLGGRSLLAVLAGRHRHRARARTRRACRRCVTACTRSTSR